MFPCLTGQSKNSMFFNLFRFKVLACLDEHQTKRGIEACPNMEPQNFNNVNQVNLI